MSNRGRPRKPTKLKKSQGTFRKDRSVKNEMEPSILDDSTPPDDLNEFGKKEWVKVFAELSAVKVLTILDHSMLHSYCNEYGKYLECEDKLRTEGRLITVQTKKGEYTMIHPLETLSQKYLKTAKEIAIQFGFTPASRTRINVPVKKDEDGGDDFEKTASMKIA